MAVNPDLLTVPPHPVTRPPDVIRASVPVSGPTNIIWPVANCDCNRTRGPIIRAAAVASIVRSIARVGRVIASTPACTKHGGSQSDPKDDRFYLHTIIFDFDRVLRACMPARLHNALIEHCVGHFHESSDVRANHEIAWMPILLGGFPGILVDGKHDVAQT
jgi:hypothetical protein